MRFKLSLHSLAVTLCTVMPLPAFALDSEFFFETSTISYSEISPIKQLVDSLEGPMIDRGDVAFSANDARLGHNFHIPELKVEIGLAFFKRIDYVLNFTPDTAWVIYADENNIELDNNRVKNIYLDVNHIKAEGISLSYTGKQFKGLEYQITASYLKADEMMEGDLHGSLTTLESDTDGNLFLDYHYTEDVLFDRERNNNTAQGYSFDFKVAWQALSNLKVGLTAKDFISQVSWSNQQQTIGTATSDRLQFSFGEPSVRAALSWQETESTIKQSLPKQYTLQTEYRIKPKDSLVSEQFLYDGHDFHRLGYRRHFWSESYASAFYDLTSKAFSFEVAIPFFKFSIISDDTKFEEAKIFGFQLRAYAPLYL